MSQTRSGSKRRSPSPEPAETTCRSYSFRERTTANAQGIEINPKLPPKRKYKSVNEVLEDHVYNWYVEALSAGKKIAGSAVRVAALEFNKQLGGKKSFNPGYGWVSRWKKHKKVRLPRDKLSSTTDGTEPSNCVSPKAMILKDTIKTEEISPPNSPNSEAADHSDFVTEWPPSSADSPNVSENLEPVSRVKEEFDSDLSGNFEETDTVSPAGSPTTNAEDDQALESAQSSAHEETSPSATPEPDLDHEELSQENKKSHSFPDTVAIVKLLRQENMPEVKQRRNRNRDLEDHVYAWYMQAQSTGIPITGSIVRAAALDFNKQLGGKASFKASVHWMNRWKKHKKVRFRLQLHQKMPAPVTAEPAVDYDGLSNRKRRSYSFQEKANLLKILKIQPVSVVARKFGINYKTLYKWLQDEEIILELAKRKDMSERKQLGSRNEELENQVYEWYVTAQRTGIPINGRILKAVSLQLNRQLGGRENFKASDCWLDQWKKRNNIVLPRMVVKNVSSESTHPEDSSQEASSDMMQLENFVNTGEVLKEEPAAEDSNSDAGAANGFVTEWLPISEDACSPSSSESHEDAVKDNLNRTDTLLLNKPGFGKSGKRRSTRKAVDPIRKTHAADSKTSKATRK